MLTYAATLGPDAAHAVEDALATAELEAVESAEPTAGASWFLAACLDVHRPVAIVSNNNAVAIEAYLTRRELVWGVAHIVGRNPDEPSLMKPNPWLLSRALDQLDVPTDEVVFVGDAVTDIEAGRAPGIPVIGYAN